MEQLNTVASVIALTMGVSWASGINLYATILMLGICGINHVIELPLAFHILADPLVIGAAGVMYMVEFFADKIPVVDNGWDALHTFIRIPAGALLAYGSAGNVAPPVALAAAILGGGLAAGTHAAKSGSRILINTSPEPFTNWFVSIGEDLSVFAGLWTAIHHPVLFSCLLVCFLLFLIWLLPKIWKGIRKLFKLILKWFGVGKDEEAVDQNEKKKRFMDEI